MLDLATPTTGFDRPVTTYMARALETARPETPIAEIAATMHARRISGVPVVDDRGCLVGVVTRTDLIALGELQAGRRGTSPAMPLPRRTARDVMTAWPKWVPRSASVRDAARMMAAHAIHRVFVTDGDTLVGVVDAVDIAAAVHDARVSAPLSTIMMHPIVTVAPHAPLSSAVELLDRLRVNALVVADDGHLLGVFSQVEALAARDMLRSTPIDLLYDPALVCLPANTRLDRIDYAGAAACRTRS